MCRFAGGRARLRPSSSACEGACVISGSRCDTLRSGAGRFVQGGGGRRYGYATPCARRRPRSGDRSGARCTDRTRRTRATSRARRRSRRSQLYRPGRDACPRQRRAACPPREAPLRGQESAALRSAGPRFEWARGRSRGRRRRLAAGAGKRVPLRYRPTARLFARCSRNNGRASAARWLKRVWEGGAVISVEAGQFPPEDGDHNDGRHDEMVGATFSGTEGSSSPSSSTRSPANTLSRSTPLGRGAASRSSRHAPDTSCCQSLGSTVGRSPRCVHFRRGALRKTASPGGVGSSRFRACVIAEQRSREHVGVGADFPAVPGSLRG